MSKHHTASAGAHATAAELSRRGYLVTFTQGNAPNYDLLCVSPETRTAFKVQVKSTAKPQFIFIRKSFLESPPEDDLFLIVALLPGSDWDYEFFILTHAEAAEIWENDPKVRRSGKAYDSADEGIKWKELPLHVDRWDKLPP
jgi:hypothetical protein